MASRAATALVAALAGLSITWLMAIDVYETPIPPLTAALYLAAGTVDAWRRPSNAIGWILLAAGVLIALGPLTRVGIPAIAIPMMAMLNVPEVLSTAVLLTFPQGRFGSRIDVAVWLGVATVIGADGIAILLLAEPARSSVPWQPVRLPVEQVGSPIYTALYPLTLIATGLIALAVAGRVVARWRGAAEPLRRVLRPVVAAALIGIAAYALASATALVADGSTTSAIPTLVFLAARSMTVLLPAAYLVAVLRLRTDRTAVVDLIQLLGASPTETVLTDRIRALLHDPAAQLLVWSDERQAWLDDAGRELPASALDGRAITRVERDGRLVAGIAHDPSLEGAEAVLGPVRAVLALALGGGSAAAGEVAIARRPLDTIGPYRVEGELGRGGMGIVYLALDIALDRRVALKVLRPGIADDAGARRRFVREARTAARLDHPAIVPVYGAGSTDDVMWIAGRWIDGQDLGALLRSRGPLPVARTVEIVTAVASALDAAAGQGFVHRDVKPSNILLDAESGTYLTDFGLTRLVTDDASGSRATASGPLLGTVDFVAPEQIRGDEIGPTADVYSLACVAYECLVGHPPFRRSTTLATLWAHLHDPAPLASDVRDAVPRDLAEVIARGLAKDPSERPGSAGDFASELAAASRPPTP